MPYTTQEMPSAESIALLHAGARCDGWTDATERAAVRLELEIGAWGVIKWADDLGAVVPTWAHLWTVLEERIHVRAITLSAYPTNNRTLADEIRDAALRVFRAHESATRRAAMADALACCEDDEPMPFGPREIAA